MFAATLAIGLLHTLNVLALPTEIFVVPPGTAGVTPEEPYAPWAKAATNIQTAVTFATNNSVGTVTVSNGVYNLTSEILVDGPIILRSFEGGLSGASNTIVKRASGSIRIFNVTDDNAVLQGLTIMNGYNPGGNGAGVYMTGGLVRDCDIYANTNNGSHGGGVYMTGGTVSNCIVRSNRSGGPNLKYDGGGIYASGNSSIVNCRILSNRTGANQVECEGGGVYSASSTVTISNCLIAGNGARRYGGGVYLANGRIENCTIVKNWTFNSSGDAGGGVYRVNGTINNSIVYFNSIPVTGNTNINSAAGAVTYTCTTGPVFSGYNNTPDDPLFVDRVGGDYTLLEGSPCIDTGANQAWMDGAKDLAGNDRKQWGRVAGSNVAPIVDMGAYEAPEPPPAATVILLW